jgi:hypothetical protein
MKTDTGSYLVVRLVWKHFEETNRIFNGDETNGVYSPEAEI